MAIGTAVGAGGTILGANSDARELRSQATQLDAQASNTRGTAQRQAIEEKRQADLAQSRGLALAAASGGGADDPSVVNGLADIAGRGQFGAITAMYNGDEQAAGMEAQAAANRRGAKAAKTAGLLKAAGTVASAVPTIISHGPSLYQKYAG